MNGCCLVTFTEGIDLQQQTYGSRCLLDSSPQLRVLLVGEFLGLECTLDCVSEL